MLCAALQNADLVVRTEAARRQKKRTHPSPAPVTSTPSKHGTTSHNASSSTSSALPSSAARFVPSDQDEQAAQARAARLFEVSKSLDDNAFRWFVIALCRLNAEMIGIPTSELGQLVASEPDAQASRGVDSDYFSDKLAAVKHPKRTGINVIRTLVGQTRLFGCQF